MKKILGITIIILAIVSLTQTAKAATPKKCGANFNCLTNRAKKCLPAIGKINAQGVDQLTQMVYVKSTNNFTILGLKNNICEFKYLPTKIVYSYTKQGAALLKKQKVAVSPIQLKTKEKELNATLAKQMMALNTCTAKKPSNLTTFLAQFKKVKFKSAECSQQYYNDKINIVCQYNNNINCYTGSKPPSPETAPAVTTTQN